MIRVTVDRAGITTVAGASRSPDFPTARADPTSKDFDLFVAQLGPSGSLLSTTGVRAEGEDVYNGWLGLGQARNGDPLVFGVTNSRDWPTIGSGRRPSGSDAFLLQLHPAASQCQGRTLPRASVFAGGCLSG